MTQRTICIATSTRADWGLLRPVAEALRDGRRVRPLILATNMHLLERFGHTADEITAAGFDIAARVPMDETGDTAAARVLAMSQCLAGTARALESMRPDALLLLGDRYEMLAVAQAAAMMGIPVIHIAGGEISEGAIDDSIRHAITKLSMLHLTATEPYRRRVIQLGEDPARVVNTGAIGVYNIMSRPVMSRAELERSTGLPTGRPFIVATFHPATLDPADPSDRCREMLAALDTFTSHHLLITYPNNDARSGGIIDAIEAFAAARPGRVTLIRSLGAERYLAAIHYADVVVGNSSSGLVEVPSAGTPTVDIGIRQQGRIAGPTVIHCGDSRSDIADAIGRALSPQMRQLAARSENPYARPDTLRLMIDAIYAFIDSLPAPAKKFYDLPQTNPSEQ